MPENIEVSLSPSPKRVILEHTNGPYRGLRQIIGWTAGEQQMNSYEEDIVLQPGKRRGDASLVKVERNYILYREVLLDSEGKHLPVRVR